MNGNYGLCIYRNLPVFRKPYTVKVQLENLSKTAVHLQKVNKSELLQNISSDIFRRTIIRKY